MKKTICDMNSLTMELKDKTAEINTVVEQINNIVIQNSKVSLNQDEYNVEEPICANPLTDCVQLFKTSSP